MMIFRQLLYTYRKIILEGEVYDKEASTALYCPGQEQEIEIEEYLHMKKRGPVVTDASFLMCLENYDPEQSTNIKEGEEQEKEEGQGREEQSRVEEEKERVKSSATLDYYHSDDDPEDLVGKYIHVQFQQESWYQGRIAKASYGRIYEKQRGDCVSTKQIDSSPLLSSPSLIHYPKRNRKRKWKAGNGEEEDERQQHEQQKEKEENEIEKKAKDINSKCSSSSSSSPSASNSNNKPRKDKDA